MARTRCAAALAAILAWARARAWRVEGELPAEEAYKVYAGKFCFDYVPREVERRAVVLPEKLITKQHAEKRCHLELKRQLGTSPCIPGKSYGCLDSHSMWVDRGCRGHFEMGGFELTCASWGHFIGCMAPEAPPAGALEFWVDGQVLEEPSGHQVRTNGAPCYGPCLPRGRLHLMLFDDEEDRWGAALEQWESLGCEALHNRSSYSFPVSSGLVDPPYSLYHIVHIRENLRPRFWYFVFVNCGAKNVLRPLNFTLHAWNLRQSVQSEFSLDVVGSVPVEITFSVLFVLIFLAAFKATWGQGRSRLMMWTLRQSAMCSAAGLSMLAMHHTVYAYNGRGLPFFGVLGTLASCAAKALLMGLLFLVARGWAFLFSPEERLQRCGFIAAFGALAALSVGAELHRWYSSDWSTVNYVYGSWTGLVSIALTNSLLAAALYSAWDRYRNEAAVDVRTFYMWVTASGGVYFALLPLVCLLANVLDPWVRAKYVERLEITVRFISSAMLLYCLWPSHVDVMVNSRLKSGMARLSGLDDEEATAFNDSPSPVLRHDDGGDGRALEKGADRGDEDRGTSRRTEYAAEASGNTAEGSNVE